MWGILIKDRTEVHDGSGWPKDALKSIGEGQNG